MATITEDRNLRWYATREPVILVLLSLLVVVCFAAVSGISKAYHAQQESLGERWFSRGVADLQAGRPQEAVAALQSALLYSRDNFSYQLSLAQALAALNQTDEALAYFLNLWEREPDSGTVNLELGRIYAKKGQTEQALRYYHNAIYAAWPDNADQRRREARLELVDFLLQQKADAQAQAELIALAANMPAESSKHLQVAVLFMQVQDYEHALAQYREGLRMNRHDAAAMAGAGRATFELGDYELARRYLASAVAANPKDAQIVELLHTDELVLQMDPFRRQVSSSKRNQIVIGAFKSAGERLKSCSGQPLSPATPVIADQKTLESRWNDLKPQITNYSLRRDPDLVDTAMDLVFEIERQTKGQCGTPSDTDQALLLISKLHGGN